MPKLLTLAWRNMWRNWRRTAIALIAIVLGLILLIAGYLVWGVFLTPMLVGGVLIVAGLAIAMTVQKSYTVHLTHRDKHTTTLRFPERSQAEQFVRALKQAGKH